MNKIFERHRRTKNIEISPIKQKIYDEAKKKMNLNYLSPKQIEKIIRNNKDVDFLDDEIKTEMNYPDTHFLADKLQPSIKKENKRKNIVPKDIVKATCLGDIIGSTYEFTDHDYNATKTEMLPSPYSHSTDDTVLSIATMNAILENKDNPDFRKHYIEEYKKFPMAGYGSSFIGWASGRINNKNGYHSMGNGCAMRISFIASYYEDIQDVIKYTVKSCMTTHDYIESIKGSVVIAVCIWLALHNYTKEDIYDYCKEHYDYDTDTRKYLMYEWCQFDLRKELSSLSNEQSKETLFVNNAVPYAIKCFYETNSYEGCMREILSHFGDADTICAIAGGLCYAFYGKAEFDIEKILENNDVKL